MSNYSMAFDRLRRESGRDAESEPQPQQPEVEDRAAVGVVAPTPSEPSRESSPVSQRSGGWAEAHVTRSAAQRESLGVLLDTIRSLRNLRGSVPFVVLAGASRAEAVERVVGGLVEIGARRGLRVVALELVATASGRELRPHRLDVYANEDLAPLEVSTPKPSEQIERWLRGAMDRVDVVVVEAPPLVDSADGALLGRALDGLFIVAEHGRTRGDHVKLATQRARAAFSEVHGIVLTESKTFLPDWLSRMLGVENH